MYLLQWFYIENLTNDDVSGSCQLQIVIYWEYLIEKSGGRSEQALNSLQKFKHLLLITKICGYILVYILRLSRKWNWIRNFNISILEIDFWILNVDINFHSQILNTFAAFILDGRLRPKETNGPGIHHLSGWQITQIFS